MNVLALTQGRDIKMVWASANKGGEYHGPCPGCGGRDRFHVWPMQNGGTGSYWCRQCEKTGDNIQWLRDFDGQSYPSACQALGVDPRAVPGGQDSRPGPGGSSGGPTVEGPAFGSHPAGPAPLRPLGPVVPTALPGSAAHTGPGVGQASPPAGGHSSFRSPVEPGHPATWEPRPYRQPPPAWMEKAAKMVTWCQEQLGQAQEVRAYLSGRGIGDEVAARFRLGWNPQDQWRPRSAWGLPDVQKEDGKPKRLWLPAGLVIPRCDGDGDGQVDRIRVRRPDGAAPVNPKYYILPGSTAAPMVLGPLDGLAWMIVESELDAFLLAAVAGDLVTVCALGSATNRPDPLAAAGLRQALVILDALDYDRAGAKEAGFWQAHFPRTVRWPVPVGKDPGEAHAAGVDIRAWVLAGLPPRWRVGQSRRPPRPVVQVSPDSQSPSPLHPAPSTQDLQATPPVDVPAPIPSSTTQAPPLATSPAQSPSPSPAQPPTPTPPAPQTREWRRGVSGVEGLAALARAMHNTPVSIAVRPNRLTVVCDPNWMYRNWPTFSAISELLFENPEVAVRVWRMPAGQYSGPQLARHCQVRLDSQGGPS